MNRLIDIEFLKGRDACKEGIKYFEEEIKEPIAARELINRLLATEEREKIKWANWLLCQLFNRPQYIQYAIFSAEQVLPIFEAKYPSDKRPREAIEAAKQVALNDTEENRKIAAKAAYVTYAAGSATPADYAAGSATPADYAAAWAAAWAAAGLATPADYAAAWATADAAGGKETPLKIIDYGIVLLGVKK